MVCFQVDGGRKEHHKETREARSQVRERHGEACPEPCERHRDEYRRQRRNRCDLEPSEDRRPILTAGFHACSTVTVCGHRHPDARQEHPEQWNRQVHDHTLQPAGEPKQHVVGRPLSVLPQGAVAGVAHGQREADVREEHGANDHLRKDHKDRGLVAIRVRAWLVEAGCARGRDPRGLLDAAQVNLLQVILPINPQGTHPLLHVRHTIVVATYWVVNHGATSIVRATVRIRHTSHPPVSLPLGRCPRRYADSAG